MATDLTNIKVGDKLAIREGNNWDRHPVDHRILVVERLTATQVCCANALGGNGEWRFSRSNGRQIGKDYTYAEIATPELLAKNQAQLDASRRNREAEADLNDLFGKHAHQLKLSLEQTEALARAWNEIKAMHKQPCDEVPA